MSLPHVGHQIFVDLASLFSMNAWGNLIVAFLLRAIDYTCVPTRLALGLVASSREDLVNVASRSFASAREDPVNVASKSLTCKRRFC